MGLRQDPMAAMPRVGPSGIRPTDLSGGMVGGNPTFFGDMGGGLPPPSGGIGGGGMIDGTLPPPSATGGMRTPLIEQMILDSILGPRIETMARSTPFRDIGDDGSGREPAGGDSGGGDPIRRPNPGPMALPPTLPGPQGPVSVTPTPFDDIGGDGSGSENGNGGSGPGGGGQGSEYSRNNGAEQDPQKWWESRVSSFPVNSQLSPLTNDVLNLMRQQITNGLFGRGMSPHQQIAGNAIQQFYNARDREKFDFGGDFFSNPWEGLGLDFSSVPSNINLTNVRDASSLVGVRDARNPGSVRDVGGPAPIRDVGVGAGKSNMNLEAMIPKLMELMKMREGEQIGDLKESMGMAGSRFGTAMSRGVAALQSKNNAELGGVVANMMAEANRARQTDDSLRLEEAGLGVERDVSFNNVISQLLGLGVNRDIAAGDMGLRADEIGINRDVSLNNLLLGQSGQGINRDLGVQENRLQADTSTMASLLERAISSGTFGLDKTAGMQDDRLRRSAVALQGHDTQQQRVLDTINAMQQIGAQNLEPFIQAMLAGNHADNTIVRDSKLQTGLDTAEGIANIIGVIIKALGA